MTMQLGTDQLYEAMQWANIAHMHQTRWYTKNGVVRDEPYSNHLLRVANTVRNYHGSIEAQIAAVLHDIVEDTDVELHEVSDRYGDIVASYVKQLTLPHGADKNPFWKCQIQIQAMRDATSDEVRLIKVADKLDNCSTLEECQWKLAHKVNYLTSADLVVTAAYKTGQRSQALHSLVQEFDIMESALDFGNKQQEIYQGWVNEFQSVTAYELLQLCDLVP